MTKEQFFDAFGQIDGAYVLAAGDAIYGKTETARVSYKKLVRTLIIAAVIAALLTLTAYAAGWFGLTGRVINDPGGLGLVALLARQYARLGKGLYSVGVL